MSFYTIMISAINGAQPAFTSRLNPVKPFSINTRYGRLDVAEADIKDIKSTAFTKELALFFCKNFASNTDYPGWLAFNNPAKKSLRKKIINNYIKYLRDIFYHDDGSMTLLVARDNKNKIQGACLSYGFDEVPEARNTTLYFDAIGVNEIFRGNKIGKLMMTKTIDANKTTFTDVFLTGATKAKGFYEKLGFRELSLENPDEIEVINFIADDRDDYPKYVKFFTKILQPEKDRWYKKAAGAVRTLDYWFASTLQN